MPVIIQVPADPTDLVVRGDQLRIAALAQGVHAAPPPAMASVFFEDDEGFAYHMMSATLADDPWWARRDFEALSRTIPDQFQGTLIRDGAVIATPCGALYPMGVGNALIDPNGIGGGMDATVAPVVNTIALDAGSYTLTGRALNVPVTRAVALAAGSYTLTGRALSVPVTRLVSLAAGSYAVTGRQLAVNVVRVVTLGAGSYSLTGRALSVPVVRTITLAAGSYSLTGRALSVPVTRAIGLGPGSYSLTGRALNVVVVPAGGVVYTIPLAAGSYSLTGRDLAVSVVPYVPPVVVTPQPFAGTGLWGSIGYPDHSYLRKQFTLPREKKRKKRRDQPAEQPWTPARAPEPQGLTKAPEVIAAEMRAEKLRKRRREEEELALLLAL